MDILDSEKRRAGNLIWNAAGDYGFEPDFRVYDEAGQADLYWNSVIGAVRKDFGVDAVSGLLKSYRGQVEEPLYELLTWLALESAVCRVEAETRPALPLLRRRYAKSVLARSPDGPTGKLVDVLEYTHFSRCLGAPDPPLKELERDLLDALESFQGTDGPSVTEEILTLLQRFFKFVPFDDAEGEKKAETKKRLLPVFNLRRGKRREPPPVRAFGRGYGEHTSESGGDGENVPRKRLLSDRTAAQSEAAIRAFIRGVFGPPLYDARELQRREAVLCSGAHTACRLYYAAGDDSLDLSLEGFPGARRREAVRQMEKNRAAYEADALRHRTAVNRLTARIRNALMTCLQPTVIRSPAGTLEAGRVWRGVHLKDDRIFTRQLNTDVGGLAVDLLLDASASQMQRQESVSAQGYMIAESLSRCGIPVRVSSFCSVSGFTVLTRFRDYNETDKNHRIFHYFATGCNRDGLAIRALGLEPEDGVYDHRMVILLSDAKPNDVALLRLSEGAYKDYRGDDAVRNAALETRSLTNRGISVLCVFTGEDEDLPAARAIYGRSFVRIRSLDQFADTVGNLIQNQIRSL